MRRCGAHTPRWSSPSWMAVSPHQPSGGASCACSRGVMGRTSGGDAAAFPHAATTKKVNDAMATNRLISPPRTAPRECDSGRAETLESSLVADGEVHGGEAVDARGVLLPPVLRELREAAGAE